jgi:hypothetical protein
MKLPTSITLNAFTGENLEVSGALASRGNRWGGKGEELAKQAPLAPDEEVSPTKWEHEDIGWGVVLTDREDVSAADKARGRMRQSRSARSSASAATRPCSGTARTWGCASSPATSRTAGARTPRSV